MTIGQDETPKIPPPPPPITLTFRVVFEFVFCLDRQAIDAADERHWLPEIKREAIAWVPQAIAISAANLTKSELANAERQIFGTTSLKHLARCIDFDLMSAGSARSKLVNWELMIGRPDRPKTVEFRQHFGTLDHDDVARWVCFVVALMRAAEQTAAQPTPTPSPTTLKQYSPPGGLGWSLRQGKKYNFRSKVKKSGLKSCLTCCNLTERRRTTGEEDMGTIEEMRSC